MSRTDIIEQFKPMLGDWRNQLSDTEFDSALTKALVMLSDFDPRLLIDSFNLVDNQNQYPLPSDFKTYRLTLYGQEKIKLLDPYEENFATLSQLITGSVIESDGQRKLLLLPAPTATHIRYFGRQFSYHYDGYHVINDTVDTVRDNRKPFLFDLCAAAALRKIAVVQANKKLSQSSKVTGSSKNGSPIQLAMEFENHVKAVLLDDRR